MLEVHGGDPEAATQALVDQLSDDELVHMLSGDRPVGHEVLENLRARYNAVPYPAGAIPRLGFPGIRFADGPRGIVVGNSTSFPIPMARAASFDPELEGEIGDAIGKEGTAQGANLFGGVCINLVRHPAWGRSQETYGEDTHLLSTMGVALTESVGAHLIACVKHFAVNSMENSRFMVDVEIADEDLHEIYLPHFRACVEAGAMAVMSAYNKVNGEWAGHSTRLLSEILKENWGFTGTVMSDFGLGVRNMADALAGGLDIEMPVAVHSRRVPRGLATGRIRSERVRDAATRTTRAVFVQAARTGGRVASTSVINSDEHRDLARRAAASSVVLLTNREVAGSPALPLATHTARPAGRVAVIGRLADLAQTGDRGSSHVRSRKVVTPIEGIRFHATAAGIGIVESLDGDLDAARSAAEDVEAAVVVVGNTYRDEGEFMLLYGGDRRSLRLRPDDESLIEVVAAACPRTIVVLVGGGAFITESWRNQVAAVVMGWYLGDEGGHALADVLFGARSPEGRLPLTWPATEAQLPEYKRWARRITYGPLHGYRLFHQTGRRPAFWFGHGLSYADIEWGTPHVDPDAAQVTIELTNRASIAGTEVVQTYLWVERGTHHEPLPTLAAFTKVRLAPGETVEAKLKLDPDLVAAARSQGGDAGAVAVGPSSAPESLVFCGNVSD